MILVLLIVNRIPIRMGLALLLLLPFSASAQDLDAADMAVVKIIGHRAGATLNGTGFVVGLEGDRATIVTASHVLEGVDKIEVHFAVDPLEPPHAALELGKETAYQRGLAVLQVRGARPAGVTALSFDAESKIERGEVLEVRGFRGVSLRPLTLWKHYAGPDGNSLQLDQPAGEGYSGSPVLRQGRVVAVVVDEDPYLTFAVKAVVARDAVLGWGGKLGGQSDPLVASAAPPGKPVPAAPLAKPCVPGETMTEKGIPWVRICPGTFTMGSAANDAQADGDEKPAHPVTVSEFWLAQTETTNAQYRRFRPAHPGEDALPAVNVGWDEAKAACESFGGRLPTEAEWEYAARAHTETRWSFGDDEKLLGEYAWYDKNSSSAAHAVGTKRANAWGLFDMHGNAWEWVADWSGPYPKTVQTDPRGPATGTSRVLRGGAFYVPPGGLRSANRVGVEPTDRDRFFGFRCARGPRRQP